MFEFIKEFWEFIKSQKKVLVDTNIFSFRFLWNFNNLDRGTALAPFIYTIF